MLQKFKNLIGAFIFFVTLVAFAGCHNYYKATKAVGNSTVNSVDSLKNHNRYFVLRTGSEAYYMKNIVLSADRKTFDCTLEALPSEHKLYFPNGPNSKMRYNPKDINVLNEVHLYISQDKPPSLGNFTLALDQIQKIEVIEKDRKRTTNSYVSGAIGYTLGAIALAAIIVVATKSSCPFVSAYTDNEFVLQGEIYGGAIYPQMARDDYMPLRMQQTPAGTLQLKISNELQERQYTDFADLLVITHDQNAKVLSDENGTLYQVNNCESPLKAFTGNMSDALPPLLKAGDDYLLHFDDTVTLNANNNYLVLQFNKPRNTKQGKLVLALKNTYWLDYLYGELAKGFGSYFPTYTKKQRKTPVAQLVKWTRDQKLPLQVEIKTKEGWQKITDITTIGPLAPREIVVPVDLSNITSSTMEIRLSSGFMFWEIDYAGIDYSLDKNFEVERIPPSVATDEAGENVLSQVIKKDGIYLEQPVPGNMATLEYKCKPQTTKRSRSYILHTKGYYEHVRHFKGKPDIAFLKKFKQPNAFPVFSLQLYKKFRTTSMEVLTQH